jgi:hypothetical protein
LREISRILQVLLLSCTVAHAQQPGHVRYKTVPCTPLPVVLDSLSLVPGSVLILDESARVIPDSLYFIDYSRALLIMKTDSLYDGKTLYLTYRVFPYSFNHTLYHKSKEQWLIPYEKRKEYWPSIPESEERNRLLEDDQLYSRGSISRGIQVGNNQDLSVNSSLNLQLSGKIGNDMNILAAITDNNIPIQPDGYTQQLQDFDKVYIKVYNDKIGLSFGDFEVTPVEPGIFMPLYKKVQGGRVSYRSPGNGKVRYEGAISGAVAKGKYCRNQFLGIEGNQGPYRLKGIENESVIIVLAGSEKVYMDGKLLQRGQENDYVIDYNLAELTFTSRQLITKDKRITVEFEYSEKSYARFMIFQSNVLNFDRGTFWLNIFSEQDSRNQPVLQDLSPEQKKLLSSIGDSLDLAITPNIAMVEYNTEQVLYKKVDSLVNGVLYQNIYVYSIHPDSARYRLGFTWLGDHRGNYEPLVSSVNGKVYVWVAPENGVPQGSYEPVVRLITPKKKQLVTLGSRFSSLHGTQGSFEFALSNNDLNTFSSRDQDDNVGFAARIKVGQDFLLLDTLRRRLKANVEYGLVNRHFEALERFRTVEFERDWNIQKSGLDADEHEISTTLDYYSSDLGQVTYQATYLQRGSQYHGTRQALQTQLRYKGWEFNMKGSLLGTDQQQWHTSFLRHQATLSYQGHRVKTGFREETEKNHWQTLETDSLLNASIGFREYELFLQNADDAPKTYLLSYKNRTDFVPNGSELKKAYLSNQLALEAGLANTRNHRLEAGIHYRTLKLLLDSLYGPKDDESLIGRIQYGFTAMQGGVSSTSFYELGRGLEMKRSFSYMEVARGQGVYRWTDYNGNKVRELDEFEIAQFKDEANYIRIVLPSNESVSVTTTQFNQVVQIQPDRLMKRESKGAKFISSFSDQLALRISRKAMAGGILSNMNPFYSNPGDTNLINIGSSFRNTFSWNKSRPGLGAEYLYQKQQNRILLVNGLDTKTLTSHAVSVRWNINSSLSFLTMGEYSYKTYVSQYFSNKNFNINGWRETSTFRIDPGPDMGWEISYTFQEKENREGGEISKHHKLGILWKKNLSNQGRLSLKADYQRIIYNAVSISSLGYEMLEGLSPGNNFLWDISYIRRLIAGIEVNISYEGRTVPGGRTIHTGGLQARALF